MNTAYVSIGLTATPFLIVIVACLMMLLRSSSARLNHNEDIVYKWVMAAVNQSWKKLNQAYSWVLLGGLIILLIIHAFASFYVVKWLIMGVSFLTTLLMGYLSILVFNKWVVPFLVRSVKIDQLLQQKNPFVYLMALLVSMIMLEILVIFSFIKWGMVHNLLGLSTYLNEWVMSSLFFKDVPSIDVEYFLIFMLSSGYFISLVLYSFFARSCFSSLSVSVDTAGDIVGYTKYDLPEDDIRNISAISDFVGDFLKNGLSSIMSVQSTILMSVYLISFFCLLFAETSPNQHVLSGLLLPFQWMGGGMLVFLVTHWVVSKYLRVRHIFQSISIQMVWMSGAIIVMAYGYYRIGILSVSHIWLVALSSLISFLTFVILFIMLNRQSWVVKSIQTYNKLNVVSSLVKGFYFSFLIACLMAFIASVSMGIIFLMNGFRFDPVFDLMNAGLCVLVMIISWFPIYAAMLATPAVDMSYGLANMFVYSNSRQMVLRNAYSDVSTLNGIAHIGLAVIKTLLVPMMIFFYLMVIALYVSSNHVSLYLQSNIRLLGLVTADFQVLMMEVLDVHILNPQFIGGILAGFSMVIFLFVIAMKGLTLNYRLISEIEDSEYESSDIWTCQTLPNHMNFHDLLLNLSIYRMTMFLGVLVVMIIIVEMLIGVPGLFGLIIGVTIPAVVLCVFFLVAGMLWGNVKRELENDENKMGTSDHVSIFMADKLGDIFKDVLGPVSLELIKLLVILLLIFISVFIKMNVLVGYI